MCAIRSIFLSGIPTGSIRIAIWCITASITGEKRSRTATTATAMKRRARNYQIYHAVKNVLPHCRSWPELENKLRKQGVTMRFKYNGHSDRMQGVLFSKNGRTFSGSKVDRAFSFSKLDHRFSQGKTQNRAQVPTAGTSSVRQPVAPRVAPVVHTTQRTGVQYSAQSVGKLQTTVSGYLLVKAGFRRKTAENSI